MIKNILKNSSFRNIHWDEDQNPHFLIVGTTGTGKTYFFRLLIGKIILNDVNAQIILCNFKYDNNLNFEKSYDYKDVKKGLDKFINMFEYRLANHKSENNIYLVFDEMAAFILSLDNKETKFYKDKIAQILMLGRSFRVHLITTMQRADAKFFSDGARDNYSIRLGLGRLSAESRRMLFPDTESDYFKNFNGGQGSGFLYKDGHELEEIIVPEVRNQNKLDNIISEGLDKI